MAAAVTARGQWPTQVTDGVYFRYYSNGSDRVYLKDAWAAHCRTALLERADAANVSDPETNMFFRFEHNNLVNLKDWVVANCDEFVDVSYTNGSGELTNIVFWTPDDLEAAIGAPTNYFDSTPWRKLSDPAQSNGWHLLDDAINKLVWSAHHLLSEVGFSNAISHQPSAGAVLWPSWATATNSTYTIWTNGAYAATNATGFRIGMTYWGRQSGGLYDTQAMAWYCGDPYNKIAITTNYARDIDLYVRSHDSGNYLGGGGFPDAFTVFDAHGTGISTNYAMFERDTNQTEYVTFGTVGYTNDTVIIPNQPSAPAAGTEEFRGFYVQSQGTDLVFVAKWDIYTNGFSYVAP